MDDERSGYPGAPPGWYPDPAGGPGQRWWDGYAWTETVVLPEAPPAPGTMPGAFGPPPGPAQFPPGFPAGQFGHGDARLLAADEFRLSRPARVAVAVPAVYLLVNLISLRANAAAYRTYGHQLHLNMQAVQNNQPQAPLTVPNQFTGSLNGLASVVALCTLLAVVLACVWQFRAASTARALGYPARRRPGWAWPSGSFRSSTTGCRIRPYATHSRPAMSTGPSCCAGGSS
jgi:hypothetical protein